MVRGTSRLASLDRDVVIYDQRGAGLSQPDPCPDYGRRLGVLESREPLGGTNRGALQTVARECTVSMQARNVDPSAFSTTANAADLVDLRRALGYERWDVYGASYGARLALEAMRRDPRGIRAVVLENPKPPGVEAAEAPLATQHALERVFAACGRSAACHTAFPRPERTLLAVFDTLSHAPLSAFAAEGTERQVSLDGEGFVLAVRSLLRSREGIGFLPLLLDQLLRGDRIRAARELLRLAEAGGGRPVRATFWLVRCYDEYGPAYRARLDSVRSAVWRPLRGLGDNLQDCPLWQPGSAAPEEGTPVESDIPTLVVTGEFDSRTPIEFGRRIAATLSRSYLFELPGETHGGQPAGCRAEILRQFMEDPERRPEASCIAAMPPIDFRTRWTGP
jgi:pimeloyl-ACP methyl ester carboxylesterase